MRRPLLLGLAAVAACTPRFAYAGPQDAPLKAALVYNISRFSIWAPGRFASASDPVVLCVEASDPLSEALKSVDGKPVGARRLAIRASAWPPSQGCHMAYVSGRHASPAGLRSLAEQGVLTIGDGPQFDDAGAVKLVTVGRQVRFEINNKAARHAGASLSAQLLRLAIKVR